MSYSAPRVNAGRIATGFIVLALTCLLFPSDVFGQPPGGNRGGGPGGPGGPGQPDLDVVDQFDTDDDGRLNTEERAAARQWVEQNAQGRGGPGGRGGPRGGRGGRGRGPGGRGGDRPTGSEGLPVAVSDVERFPDAEFYDANTLRTVFLNFEADDWEKELALFKPTDVEVPASMVVDGETYPDVGVSFRGASSFFSIPDGLKRSLNLSVDFVNDDQRLYGYKTLNLLNCNGDASLMSSYLYAKIAAHRIAAPQVNFVRVVINGRDWGVYANVQQFNKEFLKDHFDTRRGARWKVSGSPRGDGGLRYTGADVEDYRDRYEIKSKDKPESWDSLIELCRVLNETPVEELESALEPMLDIDGVLWFLAVDVALINSDGYWTRASDYYLYLDPDGRFHVLPHDMNEAFRASRGRGGPGGGGPGGGRGRFGPPPEGGGPPGGEGDRGPQQQAGGGQSGYELDPLVGLDQERMPLRSRLLAVPALREKYLQYMRIIARDLLAWEKLGPEIDTARKLIEERVEADTRKLMSSEAFQRATSPDSPAIPGSLREFSEQRSAYLLAHPSIAELPDFDE